MKLSRLWFTTTIVLGLFASLLALNIAFADTLYIVKRGDTLAGIGRAFNVSVQAIVERNNIVNPNHIYVGQQLMIPDGTSPAPTPIPATRQPGPTATPPSSGGEILYIVKAGDTLSRIASSFGVTLQAIMQRNNISNPNYIYVGQQLYIPASGGGQPQPTATSSAPQPTQPPAQPTATPNSQGYTLYTVQRGDTLARIAQRFGTTIDAIMRLNNLSNPNYIYIGQQLKIPTSGGQPQPTAIPPQPTATASAPQPTQPAAPTSVPTSAPTIAPTQAPRPVGSFALGGQTHTFANPDIMRGVGMTWVKFQHKWNPSDQPNIVSGRIADAHARGFKVLLSIPGAQTYPSSIDFGKYVEFMAGVAALSDAPDALEIWNEMNIDFEWPQGTISPESYVNNMLKPAYQRIKAANSNVMVISGAPAPTGFDNGTNAWADDRYMAGLAAAGAANYMDCVGVHHNAGATSPTATSGHPGGSHYSWYFWPTFNVYYNAFGGAKPLCITEIGYVTGEDFGGSLPPNFSWANGTSLNEHAQWLGEVVSLAGTSGKVRLLVLFNVDFTYYDPNGDPQAGFALLRPNGACPACANIKAAMGK